MADRAGALRLDRRSFLRTAGAAGTVMAAGGATAACSSGLQGADGGGGGGGGDTIKIGYVTPGTGPLAPFGEADDFVIGSIQEHFSQNPIQVGGQSYPVEVLKRDSQSDSNRAADVAADLIQNNGIHLMLVSSTPDTSNPVSDQCEANGMPCVATVTPWQPWFFGRGGTEGSKFDWTFNFFWGLEDVEAVYADMWDEVPTNKTAGALWPNDPDGLAWGDPTTGFAPAQAQRGYQIVDPGNYPNGTQDFSAQIAAFRDGNAEILLGVPIPPDFTTFWRQAAQQGYQPRIATVAKALLFPSSVEALGPLGVNLGTEVWWSPSHPFTSSLTGQSAGSWPRPTPRPPASSGRSRSASRTRCSRSRRRPSARWSPSTTSRGWPRPSPGCSSTPWWARWTGPPGRCRTWPRPRSWAGSGGPARTSRSTWSSSATSRRRTSRRAALWSRWARPGTAG
jgi:branched-chain amino acid transport system substrate-binding protein